MNLFDLTGKNAIVFGGAGGLGILIAKAYAEAGANVAIASRNEERLANAVKTLKEETGKDFRYYVCDATDEETVKATAEKANAEMGPVTILVNSQGINKKVPVFDFPVDDFNNVMNANVTSILITAKHFAPYMKEVGYGKGYRYAHNEENKIADLQCLPDSLVGTEYYNPTNEGLEAKIAVRLGQIKEWKRQKSKTA